MIVAIRGIVLKRSLSARRAWIEIDKLRMPSH